MKKKLTAIFLCVALVAIAIVGASLAYFTDTDEATNTFAVGNVKIDLIEQQRAADEEGNKTTNLEDFKQNKKLSRLDLHSLSLDLARIPLRAHGKALSFADSTSLSLDATIDSLALQPLMRDYLDRFIPAFKELDTDAILNVTL